MENLNNTLENNQTGQEVIPTQEINETPAQAISIQEKQNNILAGIKSDRLKALAQRAYDRVNAQNELVEEQPKEETKQTEQEKPQEEQPEMLEGRGKFWNKVASAGLDVAKGTLIETPARALPNAVTSAISETADLVYQIGGLELKAIDKVLGTKLSKDKDIYFPEIPEWKIKYDPEATTGQIAQNVGKFVLGCIGGGKITKGAKVAKVVAKGATKLMSARKAIQAGKLTEQGLKGVISDMAVFDGHEERLSNLIQEVPALKNPINDYLAADENDSELEGRLKNAAEGLGLGVLTDGLVRGVKAIKKARVVEDFLKQDKDIAKATQKDELEPVKKEFDFSNLQYKLSKGEKETQGIKREGLTSVPKKDNVFINFANIDTGDDVKNAIQNIADSNKKGIDKARRGVQTFQDIKLNAEQENAWKVLSERRTGQPLNAEQSLAARNLWAASGEKLTELAEIASQNPSEENLFMFRKMLDVHNMIQKEVISARTETARALSSWRIPSGGNKEISLQLSEVLERNGGAKGTRQLAETISKMAQNGQLDAIETMVEKVNKPGFMDMLLEYRTAALLTRPTTHIVNVTSNFATSIWDLADRAVSSRLSSWLGTENGVALGEATAQLKGMVGSFWDALKLAKENWTTGISKYGADKIEVKKNAIRSGAQPLGYEIKEGTLLGKAVDFVGRLNQIPFRALGASDEFFKTIGYRGELRAQAWRTATKEANEGTIKMSAREARVQEILNNPPENLRVEAMGKAEYVTFTNTPNQVAQSLQGLSRKFPMLKLIVPFINTPSNVWDFAFKHSVMAPLYQSVRADLLAGGASKDLALGRIATGSMIMAQIADWADKGIITGGGPESRNERIALMNTGWQPYSVKIGDKYFSYRRFDPISTLVGMGADFIETSKAAEELIEDEEQNGIGIRLAFLTAQSLLDTNFMMGLSNLAEAINDPQRYGQKFVEDMATSFVPGIVGGNIRNYADEYQRETGDLLDKMKNKIPGLSKDLPMKYDLFGRERLAVSGFGPIYDTLVPVRVNTKEAEPIDKEIMEQETYLAMPNTTVNYDGVEINLKNYPDIYSRYVKLAGNELELDKYEGMGCKDFLNSVIEGDSQYSQIYETYSEGAEGGKSDFIRRVVNDYREAARAELLEEFPTLANKVEFLKEQLEEQSEL